LLASIRLPGDLNKAVRMAAISRGITAELAYQEALEAWLGVAREKGKEANPPSPYLVRLEKILASGDDLIIDVATQSLEVFYNRLRPRRSKKRDG
jgi:hypothetical protein